MIKRVICLWSHVRLTERHFILPLNKSGITMPPGQYDKTCTTVFAITRRQTYSWNLRLYLLCSQASSKSNRFGLLPVFLLSCPHFPRLCGIKFHIQPVCVEKKSETWKHHHAVYLWRRNAPQQDHDIDDHNVATRGSVLWIVPNIRS